MKGKKNDTTKYQKAPPSNVDSVTSAKPVHNKSDVQVLKPKRQTKQSRSSSQNLNSDYSENQCAKVHTIKLSGLRFNITEKEIEELVKPFGDLVNRVKIVHYPGVCYAYVDYWHKLSAKEAVLRLDKSEVSGIKIHVCHKGADHNCGRELKVLNSPKKVTSVMSVLSTTPSESDTLTSDSKAAEQHEMESDKTENQAHEVVKFNPDVSAYAVECMKGNSVSEFTSIESSHRQPSKVYSVKLSGFKINVKVSEIEWLVSLFGELADPIEISQYSETNISYALVNYKQKNSAEKAVLKLDRQELNNQIIHVCHQGELAVDHDCCSILNALNAPVDQIHVVKANYDIPKTKSPVSDLTVTRTGKEVATNPIKDTHTPVMEDTKKQSGVSSKKKTASLKQ